MIIFKDMNLFVRIITFGWAAAITLAPFGIYIQKNIETMIGFTIMKASTGNSKWKC